MSNGPDTKLYVALGVLGLLGGGYYLQTQGEQKLEAAHSIESSAQELPSLSITEEETAKITKIEIQTPAKGEGESAQPGAKNVLVKDGDKWMLETPVKALANQKNVESLLANLLKLEVKEQVSSKKESYGQYKVSADKALHAVFYEGDKIVREIWAGKSGGRGQMARVDGSSAVFILSGYSSFLYQRDTKGWRDLAILELDSEETTAVSLVNEHGEFSFKKAKDDKGWSAKFKGPKAFSAAKIKEFEEKKVTDLLSAFKKLSASGFGDGKSLVEVGLDEPLATLIIASGDSTQTEIRFGKNAEGSSRWAQVVGDEQIYSISSWASDWAFAKEEKFQKSDEPATPPGPPGAMPGGLPPGMQLPPGMGGPR